MKATIPFRALLRALFFITRFGVLGVLGFGAVQAQCLPAAACLPGNAPAVNQTFGMGIFRVTLASLDTTTNGAADGYQDYACRARAAQLVRGATYTLGVRTNPNVDEVVRAWIDFDRNGTFSAAELVAAPGPGRQHQLAFTVPAAAPVGVALRLRIAADYVNAPTPTACSSPQYSQTEDYRVVVLATPTPRPGVRFAATDSVTCSRTVDFRDQSTNTPTTWRWNFGDGTASTQQHPQHTYAVPGIYSVRLRACNATGCDSLTKTNHVVFRADAPRPAPCRPTTTDHCCGFGVTRVRLGPALDHASTGGAAGYEDFSCAQRATLTADRPTTLQLTTGSSAHDVRVYLDVNDNGQFELPAELLYEGLGVQSPTVPLTVASALSGLVYHRPLRLRLWADAAGAAPSGPCAAPLRGQVEDYAVEVLPNATAPGAAFGVTYVQYCGPTRVAFANLTAGGATSYRWDFGDGSSATVAAPPVHSYATGGVYEVALVARNAFGTDTVRRTVVVASACPAYCPANGTGGSASSPTYFTRLQVANLDNTDARQPGTGYRDYTHRIAELTQGQAYALRAESLPWTFSGPSPWARVTAWLDYNQDGNFSAAERLGPLAALSPHRLPFTVPLGARVGATRLRVQIAGISQPTDPNNSCPPNYQTATTEDYTIVVFPAAQAPRAGFLAELPVSCNATVQLRDTSLVTPSTWLWSFGDGSTSTQQHPQHPYAQLGTYTVSLRAANRYGTSTATKTNYVVITSLGQGPRPAACLPPAGPATTFPVTVRTVQLGGWTYTNNAVPFAAYRDETCSTPVIWLSPGTATAVNILSQTSFNGFAFQMWLDANDDGVLDPATEMVYNSNRHTTTVNPWTGVLHLPVTTVLNRPLRLRVWWMVRNLPYIVVEDRPCDRYSEVGQVRDFTAVMSTVTASTPGNFLLDTWALAPNPAQDFVTLIGAQHAHQVELWDATGRLALAVNFKTGAERSINVAALPKGLYFVRLTGQLGMQRLVLW